jgi:hypothetical protein
VQSRSGWSVRLPISIPTDDMKSLTHYFAVALLAAVSLDNACADELAEKDRFTLRGFGTLGATTQNVEGIEYRRNTSQADGVEAGKVDFATDSIVGAQFDVQLTTDFDVVAQGVSRQRADGDWVPELTQAFVRWSPDESFVVRAGRVGYDIYLLAESRQVGYSYLTVRPTPEFYGQIGNDDIDGGDIAWTRRAGRGLLRLRAFGGAGSAELAFADGSDSRTVATIFGGTVDYLWRGWTGRIAVVQFNYDAGKEIPLLAAGLRATQFPQAVWVADGIDKSVYQSRGLQAGIAYDDGPVLAQAMYGVVDSDSLAGPDFAKFYSLFGYRVGEWTPFVSFASSRDRYPIRSAGLPDLPVFAPLSGAVIAMQEATRSTQHTTSLGVRIDLSPHVDFKLQVDRTDITDSSLIFDRRAAPGRPVDLTVIAATVDVVF